MTVYVLEVGCYEQRYIEGVYSTPEAAMAAHSPTRSSHSVKGHEYGAHAGEPWSYEWSGPDDDGDYDFGADWDDAASITSYEVRG